MISVNGETDAKIILLRFDQGAVLQVGNDIDNQLRLGIRLHLGHRPVVQAANVHVDGDEQHQHGHGHQKVTIGQWSGQATGQVHIDKRQEGYVVEDGILRQRGQQQHQATKRANYLAHSLCLFDQNHICGEGSRL